MSGNNSVGDHPVHENFYGNITGSDRTIPYLNLDERIELEELRNKMKVYEKIANPEVLAAVWYSAFYSGKLAEQLGQTSIADMEKYKHDDMESIIREEMINLDLSEEFDGEFNEENY